MGASHHAERPARYTAVAILLHWLIAAGIAALIVIGLIMTQLTARISQMEDFKLYQLHKSIGITVLLLVACRVLWRFTHRPPPLPQAMPSAEKGAAHGLHWLLYLFMIGMPLTGWAVVSSSPFNLPTVLYGLVPWPDLPVLPRLANKAAVSQTLAWVHAPVTKDAIMMLRSLVVAAAMLAGASVSAEAASWTIDTAKSHLGFTGSENGSAFSGHFGTFSGTILFDPANPAAAHADVTIATGSATTGDQQKDGALPDSDWFAADKYPQAHFVATGFKPTSGGAYAAMGTLTIRGITKPLTLPFTLAISGNTAKADGTVQLIRTDFGVGQGAWSTAQYVALQVSVSFDIVAEKSGS